MRKSGEKQGYQILLLDDEPMILMDLEDAARASGHDVLLASNCNEAIERIEAAERIDTAVLDFRLGEGRTCTGAARALLSRNVPFVLHSADPDFREADVPLEGVVHITKPSASSDVIEAALALVDGGPDMPHAAE